MTLYEQLQALVAASDSGADLAAPLATDPLGLQPPSMIETEMAVAMAERIDDLLATADQEELRTAAEAAGNDPMLRDAIAAELDRRRK